VEISNPMGPPDNASTIHPCSSYLICPSNHSDPRYGIEARRLVKRVGAGSPVCEEQAETDGLEDAGKSTNSDGIKWALLGDDL
jgi:hypothetical protein